MDGCRGRGGFAGIAGQSRRSTKPCDGLRRRPAIRFELGQAEDRPDVSVRVDAVVRSITSRVRKAIPPFPGTDRVGRHAGAGDDGLHGIFRFGLIHPVILQTFSFARISIGPIVDFDYDIIQ